MEQSKEQIQRHFGDLDANLLEECIQLCKNYSIDGRDLFYKWEALNFNTKPRLFNADSVSELRQQLQREAAKATNRNIPNPKSNLSGLLSKNLLALGRQSALGPKSIKAEGKGVARLSKVAFKDETGDSGRPMRYRYMYEKVSERSEVLDDRIDDLAEIVQGYYGIADLGDPATPTEEDIVVVGRITFDADSSSSDSIKLNEASLSLESSRAMGSGARVSLRFDTNLRVRGAVKGRNGIGFFPGAIVALRGKNGGGGWFLVNEVLTLPPLPPQKTTDEASDRPFSACIACGPFTSDLDLNYESWHKALQRISERRPSVLLLIGPFIDSSHICIKNGDIDEAPRDLFLKVFIEPLRSMLEKNPGTLVLMIPSVKDILNAHAVFPQGEFDSDLINDPRICALPNPSRFSLNGVPFAASSVDILFHLRKEELFKQASEIQPVTPSDDDAPASDAMGNLCRHVLEQRSLYPLFPVPHNLMREVNLDVSHSESLLLPGDQSKPAIIVLPSRLKQFSKVVDGTTVINPSFVAKGTYAALQWSPAKEEHSVARHVQVEILKIDA